MPSKGDETDVITRIVAKTVYEGDCWLFQGKLTGRGYGNIWYQGKMVRIGRLICHLFHGSDLDDQSWVAGHKTECPHLNCWNPKHLYVTTTKENVQEQISRGTFHYGTDNMIPNFKGNKNPPWSREAKRLKKMEEK